MKRAGYAVLKTLVSQLPTELQGQLIRYLPEEKIKALEETPAALNVATLDYALELRAVHYSWLLPLIEPYSSTDRKLFISALDRPVFDKLKEQLQVTGEPAPLKPLAQRYILRALYEMLAFEKKEFLPSHLLPDSPLKPLLALSKHELTELIDYLGLHDLSTEYKKIIKASHLQWIREMLSKPHATYLLDLVKKKEPVTFPSLHLDRWDGNMDELKKVLHQRGLNRLGKALFGTHPSLFWHLCHKLDIGRAMHLKKLTKDPKNAKVQAALTSQVTALIPKVKRQA